MAETSSKKPGFFSKVKNWFKGIGKFFRDPASEMKKVVWPTPQKVAKNTGTVILCTAVIGAFIWIFDGVAGLFIRTILDVFG